MTRLRTHFPALRSRDYRWFLRGGAISYTGDWMDWVALNWLVLELTNSAFAIGVYNFFRAAPTLLLTLPGGVLADRYGRRRVMLVNQTAAMLLTGVLTALVYLHRESFPLIVAIAACRGAFISLDRPARQVLIPNLVPLDALTNAVALHSAIRNAARIVGPAIAGVLLGSLGVKFCLLVNSLSYLPVIFTLLMIRERTGPVPRAGSMRHHLMQAARYVHDRPVVLALVTLAIVPMLLGHPYSTLVPIFARDLLLAGATGLGFLLSAAAVGSVLGALAVALWGHRHGGGTLLLGSIFVFGTALVGFAFSRWFPLSLLLLFAAGLSNQVYGTLSMTLLQELTPDELRGRIMSLHSLTRGLIPLGAVLLGSLASLMGAPLALAAAGGGCALLAVGVALLTSELANLKPGGVTVEAETELPP